MRNLLGWLAVLFCAALCASAAFGQFHPRDLEPTFYVEAVDTFTNPTANTDCVGADNPDWCCSGAGTGSCDDAVSTFGELATCTDRAADCVGSGDPNACCTGAGAGATCCWELVDSGNGGRGPMYCKAEIFPDGCVQRWVGIAWEGGVVYKNGDTDTPISPVGRPLAQDDHELMGYVADCFANGLPCVRGRSPWFEPDGAGGSPSEQPSQDGTMEFGETDRTWTDCTTSEAGWMATLVRPVPQTGNCDTGSAGGEVGILSLGTRVFGYDVDTGAFYLANSGTVSATSKLVDNKWQLLELVRDGADAITFYIDGVDETTGTPTSTQAWNPADSFIGCAQAKNCDWNDSCGTQGHEFQGDYAMILVLCSAPTAQNRSDLLQYAQDTWAYQNEPVRRGGSQGAAIQAN